MKEPGSIVSKRGGWWVVLSTKDPKTGRRLRPWHGPYETEADARIARAKLVVEQAENRYAFDPERHTVAQYLERWLRSVRGELRPATLAQYETQVRAYLVPWIGRERLTRLDVAAVRGLYATLTEKGGRGGRPLAPKTVANAHRVLRHALADALDEGLIARNPAALARPPKARRREMKTWSPEQLRAFLEASREQASRLHGAFVLAATTGMRRGEVLGLRWQDVDLEAGRLAVVQSLVMVGTRPELSTPKTDRSVRSIPLAPATVTALHEHRKRQAAERLAAGPAWHDHGLVFAREDGSPLRPDHFAAVFGRIAARAGLPRIRFHDLRHSFATSALRAGIHPKVVSELLGHSSVTITLDTYSHVAPSIAAEATTAVAGLIFGS